MRITIVSPSLAAGGAERSVVLQSRGLSERGHAVSVITLSGTTSDFYELHQGVGRLALNLAAHSPTLLHALASNRRRLRELRRAVRSTQPDAVISHTTSVNVLTIVALMKAGYPVFVVEHNDPTRLSYGKIWGTLRRILYPRAARVISVSRGVQNYFNWLPDRRKVVIHNPINPIESKVRPRTRAADGPKKIVAMGRLIHQKGYDCLIRAFDGIANVHLDWQLLIIGEGELRNELETLRDNLGLTDRIHFTGLLNDPFPVLRSAQLFVMASRFEGFPYALLEAMACGLPVIYTDCPSGPGEIIRHGIDGLLTPCGDERVLAEEMSRLMSNEAERDALATRAPEVVERFGLESVCGQWEQVIREVIAEGPESHAASNPKIS